MRDRRRLSDWCETIGPVVFEPAPSHLSTAPLDRLAVVSWNTHVGGGDLVGLIDAVRRGDYTGGERFEDMVLLLQEMYRHGDGVPEHPTLLSAIPSRIVDALHARHERDARQFAHELGFAVMYAPSMRNGLIADDPEDRGNAILSTLPLSNPAVIELPFEHQRRVAPVAVVGGRTSRGGPWRVRLVDVHLDTAIALMRGGPFAARRRQAEALITALTRDLPFSGMTLIGGDFNTWFGDREPAVRLLRRAFPDAPPANGATWIGPLGIHATLDHVFASGELRSVKVQRLPSRFGSDHFPLLTVMSFAN